MGVSAVIQTFCFYNNIFERLADYYYHFSILFMPLILIREPTGYGVYESNESNNSSSGNAPLTKKKIGNYSFDDIDVNTVLAVVITVFCVWRFISYTGSGSDHLTPFYFFWEGMPTSI